MFIFVNASTAAFYLFIDAAEIAEMGFPQEWSCY